MPIDRLSAAALALAVLAAGPALAQQSYPSRTITIIAPFSPGTGIDILARTCGQKLSERWGVPVVVDNKPGASGNIGTELAARAAGDGYTLMMTATTFALNSALSKKAQYDPLKSFAPVSLVATGVLSFAVSANTPAANIGEFVALAKSNPGKLNYASSGNGTPQHLTMELFKLTAGVDVTHVPYKGAAEATKDLAGGYVDAMILPVHTVAPLVHAGKVRLLAVLNDERSPVFPAVPTLRDAGYPEVESSVWYGLMAPATTPADIVRKLNGEISAILALADVKEILGRQGLAPAGGQPERLSRLVGAELERWRRVIAQAKIRAD
jgi:tripartite-type tricarboxylate transporter receptor subunit TctC